MSMFDITGILLSLPAILLALTVHEFSHAWAALKMGDPTARNAGRLTLNPLKHIDPLGFVLILVARIGWAKPVPVNPLYFRNPARGLALTSLAGPLSNIALAVASGIAFRILGLLFRGAGLWKEYFGPMLAISVIINIALAFFNLIPLPPLDGFAILAYFFPKLGYNPGFIRLGPFILMALIVLGLFLPVNPIGLYLAPFLWIGTWLLLGVPMGLFGG
jgi:Zn-dependent protease